MINELSNRIWSHEAFHDDLATLHTAALESRYISASEISRPINEDLLVRLLKSATSLSASSNVAHRERLPTGS